MENQIGDSTIVLLTMIGFFSLIAFMVLLVFGFVYQGKGGREAAKDIIIRSIEGIQRIFGLRGR